MNKIIAKENQNPSGKIERRKFKNEENYSPNIINLRTRNVNNDKSVIRVTKMEDSHRPIKKSQLKNLSDKTIKTEDFHGSISVNQLTNLTEIPIQKKESFKPSTASKAFEKLLNKVGDNHRFQWKMFFVAGITGFFTATQNLGAVFLAATPNHFCKISYLEKQNFSVYESQLNLSVPWIMGKIGKLEPSKCQYYVYDSPSSLETVEYLSVEINSTELTPYKLLDKKVRSCNSWIYDNETYISTVVSEWDLVCDNKWMKPAVQSTFMIGILIGAVIFTIVSDKLGRRLSTLICGCSFIVTSVAVSFANSFTMFLVLRFLVAATGQGLTLVTFVLLMEFLGLKSRNLIGNLSHIFFYVGFLYLNFISYLIRDWRTVQLFTSIPTLILLMHIWCLPESARWLLMQGKEEEGTQGLKSISKCNDIPFPSQDEVEPLLKIIKEEVKCKPYLTFMAEIISVLDMMATLVRTPNMRRRNLTIFYCWFVCSMLYYGLTFSGGNLSASAHTTGFYWAISDFIGIGVLIAMMHKLGRRLTLCISHLAAGLSCISIIFLPTDQVELKLALAVFGKTCIGISFGTVFIFSVELVPTYIRSISMGMASVSARIGSALAPFIVDLLGEIYFAIPSTIFGVLSLLAGLLSILLPETGNKQLPESIEEIESLPR